jgi:hypothetical protein
LNQSRKGAVYGPDPEERVFHWWTYSTPAVTSGSFGIVKSSAAPTPGPR